MAFSFSIDVLLPLIRLHTWTSVQGFGVIICVIVNLLNVITGRENTLGKMLTSLSQYKFGCKRRWSSLVDIEGVTLDYSINLFSVYDNSLTYFCSESID